MTIYRAFLPCGDIIESPLAKTVLSILASALREDGMPADEVWDFIVRTKGRVWQVIPA